MHQHHKRAIQILSVAVTADVVLGVGFAYAQGISIWLGLYFATTTATTVGYGDITPHGWAAHLLAVLMMVTVIPLFAASFSLVTSGLTAAQADRHHKALVKLIREGDS